jgi:hypothetical protein
MEGFELITLIRLICSVFLGIPPTRDWKYNGIVELNPDELPENWDDTTLL